MNDPQSLIRKKNRIIYFLGVLSAIFLLFILYFLVERAQGDVQVKPLFLDPVPDATSKSDIDLFRGSVYGSTNSNIVVYEKNDIKKYIDCTWPQLTTKPAPSGYHWAVGFYFVHKTVGGNRKLDFYVIPTLAATNPNGSLSALMDFDQYYNDRRYYDSDPKTTCAVPLSDSSGLVGGGNAYDAGQLYP